MHKEIGKIKSVKLGKGGYDDAMFGVSFSLGGESWGTGDFWGQWAHDVAPTNAKWTTEGRNKSLGENMMKLKELMDKAKVSDISHLEGIPIECTFENACGALIEWRILTEVI